MAWEREDWECTLVAAVVRASHPLFSREMTWEAEVEIRVSAP